MSFPLFLHDIHHPKYNIFISGLIRTGYDLIRTGYDLIRTEYDLVRTGYDFIRTQYVFCEKIVN